MLQSEEQVPNKAGLLQANGFGMDFETEPKTLIKISPLPIRELLLGAWLNMALSCEA